MSAVRDGPRCEDRVTLPSRQPVCSEFPANAVPCDQRWPARDQPGFTWLGSNSRGALAPGFPDPARVGPGRVRVASHRGLARPTRAVNDPATNRIDSRAREPRGSLSRRTRRHRNQQVNLRIVEEEARQGGLVPWRSAARPSTRPTSGIANGAPANRGLKHRLVLPHR